MTEVPGSTHGVSYGRASDEGGIFSRFLKFLIGVRIKVKFGTIHGAVILIATGSLICLHWLWIRMPLLADGVGILSLSIYSRLGDGSRGWFLMEEKW